MDILVTALGPVFVVGLVIQQLFEFVDPILNKVVSKRTKRFVTNLVSFIIGLGFSYGSGIQVLGQLGVVNAGLLDLLVTGVAISACTEGFNSVTKFLFYAKERKKDAAAASGIVDRRERFRQAA